MFSRPDKEVKYREQDSNLHTLRHLNLNQACLPIPPSRLRALALPQTGFLAQVNSQKEPGLQGTLYFERLTLVNSHDPISREEEPKIYLLPNLMTAGNLLCGFLAVLTIFQGMQADSLLEAKPYYRTALFYILGACIFDLLDGRLARLGGQDSPFGREFDSLADIVSFGIAPAMLVSRAVLFDLSLPGVLSQAESGVTWAIAFIYLLCGAVRLARFNCLAAMGASSHDFKGIPIPMAAGFIASLTFLIIGFHENQQTIGAWSYLLAAVMVGVSLLMVSDVRYPSFKKLDLKTRSTRTTLIIGAIMLAIVISYREYAAVLVFVAYLLYGLIRSLFFSKNAPDPIEATLEEQRDHED